ncbi:MAG: hypothetical protein OQK82_08195 [Candidatus Pacearchaeota archaeon]|nr:hypothetical protein [Candidatus Pacearchaeota archaeon]
MKGPKSLYACLINKGFRFGQVFNREEKFYKLGRMQIDLLLGNIVNYAFGPLGIFMRGEVQLHDRHKGDYCYFLELTPQGEENLRSMLYSQNTILDIISGNRKKIRNLKISDLVVSSGPSFSYKLDKRNYKCVTASGERNIAYKTFKFIHEMSEKPNNDIFIIPSFLTIVEDDFIGSETFFCIKK